MTRSTSQRGVSLLLLTVMITVVAGVAIGAVTLLRTRHESYPYQVQSYQAHALAHAGVEFGIGYAQENPQTFQAVFPNTYDGTRKYSLGNGEFEVKYLPGCPDTLYSRGTCGTATREVRIQNLGLTVGALGNTTYISSGTYRQWYQSAMIYTGFRIGFTFCDPSRLTPTGGSYWSFIRKDSVEFAATQPVTIMRFGVTKPSSAAVDYEWVFDGACGGPAIMGCSQNAASVGGWDGVSDPPNASVTPAWNVTNAMKLTNDISCRPRQCSPDPNICPLYGFSRTWSTCTNGGPIRDLSFGNWQGHICFETLGSFTSPTTFYIAFDHAISVALAPPPWNGGATNWVRNKFIVTVY